MLILIDDARLYKIEKLYDSYPYDGVTTNPSILMKAGGNPMENIKNIRKLLPETSTLHAQVISTTAESIVEEGRHMADCLGNNFYVKIPASSEGCKAMSILSKEGIKVTATTIYSPMQAFLAAKAGASYLAVYVNRIDNLGYNGIEVTRDIQKMLTAQRLNCSILGASFKNTQQIIELCKAGIGAVTVAPEILDNFLLNSSVDAAINSFTEDFESFTGSGFSMLNY